MRFSMKWVLLGMAYVAVAAAAFSQGHWVYADLLWLAAFLGVCYALITAAAALGARRAVATGFAIFAIAFALCAQFADDAIPTRRLLAACGVSDWTSYPPLTTLTQPNSAWALVASGAQPYAPSMPSGTISSSSSGFGAVAAQPTLTIAASPVELPFASKLRAANAIGTMLLGLIGGWLAAAAFRRHRVAGDGSAA
jgi:hypothetical protein